MKLSNYLCAVCVLSMCGCSSRVGESCGDGGSACGLGEYCKLPVADCGSGASGECEAIPDICTEIFSPVCGCDGETYSNECDAASSGVSLASAGACESDPQLCGGIAGLACDDQEYCKYEVGSCEVADRSGECEVLSEACLAIADPVCGCDGVTYDNECTASLSGVSVAFKGQCEQSACCDPAEMPGENGTGPCVEGVSCCSDGQWECNEAVGESTCAELGEVCSTPGSVGARAGVSSAATGNVLSPG